MLSAKVPEMSWPWMVISVTWPCLTFWTSSENSTSDCWPLMLGPTAVKASKSTSARNTHKIRLRL